MTPQPNPEELRARSVFDPIPGSFHFLDLIDLLKDGIYAKDRPSAYVIGLLLFAKEAEMIKVWEGQLMQIPFVRGMVIRANHPNFGHPFLDPDGNVMGLPGGRTFNGSLPEGSFRHSTLTVAGVKAHAGYDNWLQVNYNFNGAAQTYARVSERNSLKTCDDWVNSQPYNPGPLSVTLGQYANKYDVDAELTKTPSVKSE